MMASSAELLYHLLYQLLYQLHEVINEVEVGRGRTDVRPTIGE